MGNETRWILIAGALLGGVGVALGAFGAHALRSALDALQKMAARGA